MGQEIAHEDDDGGGDADKDGTGWVQSGFICIHHVQGQNRLIQWWRVLEFSENGSEDRRAPPKIINLSLCFRIE